jgi:ABC transporter substrate binding protein
MTLSGQSASRLAVLQQPSHGQCGNLRPLASRSWHMRRRDFITVLGWTAATWPLAAPAQQPATPVIGFLHSASPTPFAHLVAAYRQGLKDTGYVEGQNLTVEYRWAEGQFDRLPSLAADLVRRDVRLIAALGGSTSPLAAKKATATIPIVFSSGRQPQSTRWQRHRGEPDDRRAPRKTTGAASGNCAPSRIGGLSLELQQSEL